MDRDFLKLQSKFRRLTDERQFNLAVGRAARYGMRAVRDKARSEAKSQWDDPSTDTDISKNIVVRAHPRRGLKKHEIGARVGVLGGSKAPAKAAGEVAGAGKGNPGGDTWYWRLLEFGFVHRSGKSVPPRPVIRPALESEKDEVLRRMFDNMKATIEKLSR